MSASGCGPAESPTEFLELDSQAQELTRACGAVEPGSDSSPQCAPLRFVGRCSQVCTSQESLGLFYTSCTFNGVSYRPLTTRMKVSDYDELFPDSGH
jgi:hypothetical protein